MSTNPQSRTPMPTLNVERLTKLETRFDGFETQMMYEVRSIGSDVKALLARDNQRTGSLHTARLILIAIGVVAGMLGGGFTHWLLNLGK